MIETATPQETAAYGSGRGLPKNFIPLRADPSQGEDSYDTKRAEMVLGRWSKQDSLLRMYHRQIEENIRMLAGQQWSIWHPLLQRWLDVTEWMSEQERRFRLRPVMNRLLPWFMITTARATENSPIITFAPGPDRIDSELAEVSDIIFKTLWREMGMTDANDRLMGWVVSAGTGYLATRVDANAGPMRQWIGRGRLPVLDPNTGDLARDVNSGEPVFSEEEYPNVPFGPDGSPFDQEGNALAMLTPDGPVQLGEPHEAPEGKILPEVRSPLQVRGSWGPQPWHEKPEHYTRDYLTPEQVWDAYGVDCEPEVRDEASGDVGELERILFGTGFFHAASGNVAAQSTATSTEGYVEVTTRWQAPCGYGGMEKRGDSPGGRLTVVTKRKRILYDGVRPAPFPYTSPIRCFDFVRLPGRHSGTTPIEAMNPQQRAYNRSFAQVGEHVNLCTNPKPIIDAQSGIQPGQWTNEPGRGFVATRRSGVPAVEWVSPPQLSDDVFKYVAALRGELEFLGQMAGAQGEAPTEDPSGELIKELRFNSDRYFGPTMKRAVEEYARFAEDLLAIVPYIYDEPRLIEYAGEDNVARTIQVMPYMFKEGKVNVVPDVESMMPEGRGDRQARVHKLWLEGAFGDPLTPESRKMFFDLSRFPHLSRTAKPGGIDRTMADQFNGRLLQGEPAEALPFFPWYDAMVHLSVLAEFMKGPEFLKQQPQVQAAFIKRWQTIQGVVAQAQAAAREQNMQEQERLQAAKKPGTGGEDRGGSALSQGGPNPPQGKTQQEMPTSI